MASIGFDPERIVDIASEAVRRGEKLLAEVLEKAPGAVYLTDADGVVTHFNAACRELAGRAPRAGEDRWCVWWRLYDADGAPVPNERSPMAMAISERRPVRGVRAIAERPDGSRVELLPHPTPIFDEDARMLGAVNLVVDLGDARYLESLRRQSARWRALAMAVDDACTAAILEAMAADYDERAEQAARPDRAAA